MVYMNEKIAMKGRKLFFEAVQHQLHNRHSAAEDSNIVIPKELTSLLRMYAHLYDANVNATAEQSTDNNEEDVLRYIDVHCCPEFVAGTHRDAPDQLRYPKVRNSTIKNTHPKVPPPPCIFI